ncbi:unnamed protein product, partial [Iphiclides podalirius]
MELNRIPVHGETELNRHRASAARTGASECGAKASDWAGGGPEAAKPPRGPSGSPNAELSARRAALRFKHPPVRVTLTSARMQPNTSPPNRAPLAPLSNPSPLPPKPTTIARPQGGY